MTKDSKFCHSVSLSVMSDSFVTPWTVALQAPLSMGLCRQEYWSGLPFPSPEDLPDPGIEHMPPALAGAFFTPEPPVSSVAQSCLTLCNPMDCSMPWEVHKF